MLKGSLLFLFFCGVLFLNAQQVIVLENKNNGKIKTIKLPASVYCEFEDGRSARLILTQVKEDSLIFKKYYNKPEIFDCKLSALQKFSFEESGDVGTHLALGLCAMTASFFVPLTILGSMHQSTGPGDPVQLMAIVFGVPISIISLTGTALLISKLPKSNNKNNWFIYAK